HQSALQTSALLVHAHLSTLIEHGHVASVNQPRRAMASIKERLRSFYEPTEVDKAIAAARL
ncbi:hypothetical protein, partial [Burkholderia cenocepacia]|uniref:hypothetical protein n=1 Tax=Burkholderia cenocepacia TaxID=95486 RepID=UPI001BA07975